MQIIEDQRWLAHVPNVMSVLETYMEIIKDTTDKKDPKQKIVQLNQCIKNDFDFSALGYHPVYSELFKRYSNMLADNWEQIANTDISRFRDEIGCNPMRITATCFDTNSLINKYNNKLMYVISLKKCKTMFSDVSALMAKREEVQLEDMRKDLSRYRNIRFSEKGFAIDNMAKQGMRKELPLPG